MKKIPAPRPIGRGREADVLVHRQRGEADVDAVEEGDEVQEREEGNQAPADLYEDGGALFIRVAVRIAHDATLPDQKS